MKLIDRYKAIQQISPKVKVPFWDVSRIVQGDGHKELEIVGDMIGLGGESDLASPEEVRHALTWYVEQLGGTVKWKKV
jgi:hypothetical protein